MGLARSFAAAAERPARRDPAGGLPGAAAARPFSTAVCRGTGSVRAVLGASPRRAGSCVPAGGTARTSGLPAAGATDPPGLSSESRGRRERPRRREAQRNRAVPPARPGPRP